jgi:hypothetical protein
MSDMLRGAMIGHMLGSDGGRAERNAAVAEAELAAERKITKHKIDAADWRSRATILAANVQARKMSEDALLKALQEENANHPLASREAFEELFRKGLSEEDAKRKANYEAYAEDIARRIP